MRSNPAAGVWIDARINDALSNAFDKIAGYQRDGYCTEDDVIEALTSGWDEVVTDAWREYIGEED